MPQDRPLRRKLTPRERQALKRRAHRLKPVVLVGQKGLTQSLLREIDRSLEAHGLMKIRLSGEREARRKMAEEIAARLGAELVQLVGRIAILYRASEHDEGQEGQRHHGE